MDEDNSYFHDLGAITAILFHIVGVNPAPWPVKRSELARS